MAEMQEKDRGRERGKEMVRWVWEEGLEQVGGSSFVEEVVPLGEAEEI